MAPSWLCHLCLQYLENHESLTWFLDRLGRASHHQGMCNVYSITKGQAAIIELTRAMRDTTGNLPPMPGVFPDYKAPVVAHRDGVRELCLMRWGMPSSQKALLDAATKRAEKSRAKSSKGQDECGRLRRC